ncbi:hypothetical protein [Bacteroides gallinarum]|uniref:hypothetical protein n=1 Tax=Bacteroides gallinarum TaxID=376806 RepID=UPI0004699D15|nr:hypothetical protein [Bacteroides gallinarum]
MNIKKNTYGVNAYALSGRKWEMYSFPGVLPRAIRYKAFSLTTPKLFFIKITLLQKIILSQNNFTPKVIPLKKTNLFQEVALSLKANLH